MFPFADSLLTVGAISYFEIVSTSMGLLSLRTSVTMQEVFEEKTRQDETRQEKKKEEKKRREDDNSRAKMEGTGARQLSNS